MNAGATGVLGDVGGVGELELWNVAWSGILAWLVRDECHEYYEA